VEDKSDLQLSPTAPQSEPVGSEEEKERAKRQLEDLAQERIRREDSRKESAYAGLLLSFEAKYGELYDPWRLWRGESTNQPSGSALQVPDTAFADAMKTLAQAISREYSWDEDWGYDEFRTFPETLARIAQACRLVGASGRSQAFPVLEKLRRFTALVRSYDEPDDMHREYEVGGPVRNAAHFALLDQLRLNASETADELPQADFQVGKGAFEDAMEMLTQAILREYRWEGDWEPLSVHETLQKLAQACRLIGVSGQSQALPVLEKLRSFEASAECFGAAWSYNGASEYGSLPFSSWHDKFNARHSYDDVGETVRLAAHLALLDQARLNIDGVCLHFGLRSREPLGS
jgi:hypothetical protein